MLTSLAGTMPRQTILLVYTGTSALGGMLLTPLVTKFQFPFTSRRIAVLAVLAGAISSVMVGHVAGILLYVRLSPEAALLTTSTLAGLLGGVPHPRRPVPRLFLAPKLQLSPHSCRSAPF